MGALRDPAFWIAVAIGLPLARYGINALDEVAESTFPPVIFAAYSGAFFAWSILHLFGDRVPSERWRTVLAALEVVLLASFVLYPLLRYGLGARW